MHIPVPDFDHIQGGMTDYKDLPFIVAGSGGYEVEHFNGQSWDRKQDLPGPGPDRVENCALATRVSS